MATDTNVVAHSRTITGFFDTKPMAEKAVADLKAAGIPGQHITLLAGQDTAATTAAAPHGGGFWESLKEMFLPEEDQHAYAEGLRRGGYLVSVNADEANYNKVLDIIDVDGSVDMDERETSWKSEGWQGYTPTVATGTASMTGATAGRSTVVPLATPIATPAPVAARVPVAGLAQDETIQLVEEQLRVGKRDVNHGRVRLRSYVIETPVTEQVSLHAETVHVDRKVVDRPVSATDALFQDRVIEVEEHAEEAVIAKNVRVTEEIALRKTADDRVQTVTDTVRRTEVEIDDGRKAEVGGVRKFVATSDAAMIVARMDVIAADGPKIGTVEKVDGADMIQLAKWTSPDGQQHRVPLAWVDHVDQHVHLNKTATAVKAGW